MFWLHPGSTNLWSKCSKLAISSSCQRSAMMAPQLVAIQTPMTCPMTILVPREMTPLRCIQSKTLIPPPFRYQIHHMCSLHLHPPQKQAPHLPKSLLHLLTQDSDFSFTGLSTSDDDSNCALSESSSQCPPSLMGHGPQKRCTHMCATSFVTQMQLGCPVPDFPHHPALCS